MSRILIVDDNAENRYLLEVLLKKGSHDVRTAANGAEALSTALCEAPDIVISDILMPVMDGFTLCHEWRANEKLKDIPFIFYTATYTEPKDEELALSLGADRFVIKPQQPEEIERIIGEELSRPRMPARTRGDVPQGEGERLKKYSEVLFRKLEKKISDLEIANRELGQSMEERLRGEKALRASEEKYRIVADNTYYWEFWLDPDGGFIYVSPSCKRITGRECAEFIRDPRLMRGIVHPEDLPRFDEHGENVEKRHGMGSLEFRILHSDGSPRWIAHDCLPVFSGEGKYLGIRGSNRDITETKRLEEQLRQSQKMETVGRLAGGITHDFNNILTVIFGFIDMLRMELSKESPLHSYLDQVSAAAERASNLTSSLLLFSRKQAVKFQAVNLNELVKNMEGFIRAIVGGNIQLGIIPMKKAVNVYADSAQMEQVIMNLATNARDAMKDGGRLSIEIGEMGMDEQFIHAHGYGAPGRYAVLSVSDTGIGMDEKIRQAIFEPFFTTKGAGEGTGLGLSIVYGILKQHNGYIDVYSEAGRGSSFRLLFPLLEAETAAKESGEPEAPLGGSETILIADDDPGARNIVETYLKSLGYSVVSAENGEEAVGKFAGKSGAIDLVVLDAIMPKKNGKEASKEIRSARKDVKILLMSGYPADVIVSQGFLEKGIEFVMKPMRPVEFARKVRNLLDKA